LVQYAAGKTTPSFVVQNITFRGACNIKYAKMFLIQGEITTETFTMSKITIKESTTIGDSDSAKAMDSSYIYLSGVFQKITISELNLIDKVIAGY
jgi:hypothetical protein